jgi:MOB kinase activator 1
MFQKRDRATLKETKPHSNEKRGTLSKMTQRTLGGGNMKAAVLLPQGEDINDWIAANTVDFFNELTLLYGIIASEAQDKFSKAGEGFPTGFEYRWSEGPDSKPIRVSAPEYVDYVFSWIESQIDDPKIFPVNENEPFPPDFVNHYAKDIFKRMFRCFAIIYHRHVEKITAEGAAAHLNTCFKHFMYFCFTFKLLDDTEVKVLQSLVDRLKEEYDKASV